MLDVVQVAADAAFGTDLDALLAANGGKSGVPPASIAVTLGMALVGARGETAAELATALHVHGPEAPLDG
jgi:hypothetical protein